MSAWLTSFCLIAQIVMLVTTASAQGEDSRVVAATAAHAEGERLWEARSYAGACPKFAESRRLDPQVGVTVKLALCYEVIGQLTDAWALFQIAAEQAKRAGDDSSAEICEKRLKALEEKLSHLTINVSEVTLPGLQVRRDGTLVGAAVWGSPVPVTPGVHEIEASAPGKRTWKCRIRVPELQSVTIPPLSDSESRNSPLPHSPLPHSPLPHSPLPHSPLPHSPPAPQRVLTYVVGGTGIAGLALGAGFYASTVASVHARDSACPADGGNSCPSEDKRREYAVRQSDATESLRVSRICSGMGAGLLAAAGVLWLVEPKLRSKSGDRGRTSPVIAVAMASRGILVEGTW